MVKYFTNFVKYGNPSPEGEESLNMTKWEEYSTEKVIWLDRIVLLV